MYDETKIKKMICGILIALSVFTSTAPVFADTVWFDVTAPGDPKSKRVRKADNEQNFYVTGDYFSSYGTLSCRSYNLDNQHIFSEYAYISEGNPKEKKPYEVRWAPYDQMYFLMTWSSMAGFNVTGFYTP